MKKRLASVIALFGAMSLWVACATTKKAGTEAAPAQTLKEQPPPAPEVSEEAKKAFEGAVELYQIQKKTGNIDYQALIDAFREVIRQNPRAAEAYYNLGCLYEAIRDDQQAAESYQKALDLRPDLAPAAANWGSLLARQGKLDQALLVYQKALTKEQKNSQVLLNMASIYHQQKKLDEALRSAGEVLVRDPTNVGAYRIMAAVYYDKGDLDMAHLICLRGLVVRKDDPKLLNTLGLVLLGLKRVPEALASFRQALEKAPDMVATRFNIAKVALDYKDFAVAREQFAKILQFEPENRKAAIGLGIAMRMAGDFEGARKHFESLAAKWPKWSQPHYWLGVLYLRNMNNPQEALKSFAQFTKMAGDRLPEKHPVFAAIKEAEQGIEMEKKMKEAEARAMEEAKRQEELLKKLAEERVKRLDEAWAKVENEGGVLPPQKLDARELPFIVLPPAISVEVANELRLFGMEFKDIKEIKVGDIRMVWKQEDPYTIVMKVPKLLGFDAKQLKNIKELYGPWDITIFYKDADPVVFAGGLWVGEKQPPKQKPQEQPPAPAPQEGSASTTEQAPAQAAPAPEQAGNQPQEESVKEAGQNSQAAPAQAQEPKEPKEPEAPVE